MKDENTAKIEKNYKVVFIPALGKNNNFEKYCDTLDEAEFVLDAISDYTLMLHDYFLMEDYSNSGFVLKKQEDGSWLEIDTDENV